ncbi:MAG: APC family permease [Ginsengibacter sp.]
MPGNTQQLQRRLGLFHSTVLNMIDMVGIGPFVTLSIVISTMNGPWFLYAWIAGALLSVIDAMIWSELGAAYPFAGGSYNFLKEGYGKNWGKMMSFLYIWQTIIQAPLVAASAAIGFSQYLGYLIHLEIWEQKAVSALVIILVTFLLYRRIDKIGKIAMTLWMGVILTLGWIIFGGITHGNFTMPLKQINNGFEWSSLFFVALGQASVKTVYSYLGYYNVCHLGGEIKEPGKNIPRSMFISVAGIAILYLAMNISVTSVIPWYEIKSWQDSGVNNFVVSIFFERLYGTFAGKVATIMILWVALASLFAVMLGYSRVPYAAASDGAFFKIFSRLHPTKNFPYISLLILAGFGLLFSLLFKMKQVIDAVLAMRIIVQFIGQGVGVMLLRKRNGTANLPYKMPLYPLPVILAIIIWLLIFLSTGWKTMMYFVLVFLSGIAAFLANAKLKKQWPFESI